MCRRSLVSLLVWMVMGLSLPIRLDAAEELRNAHVSITVDPTRGGGVTAITHRTAVQLPFLADKGAGIAGTGRLFLARIEVAGQAIELADQPMQIKRSDTTLALAADLSDRVAGMRWQRTITLPTNESGFRISDRFTNASQAAVTLTLGGGGEQQPEPWCITRQCWFGSELRWASSGNPSHANARLAFESPGPAVFWRNVGPYGVGFLVVTTGPTGPVRVEHHTPRALGNPAMFRWQSLTPITIKPGDTTAVEIVVLVDEGGRQGTSPEEVVRVRDTGVLATLDVRAAGRSGESLPAFATVVSTRPRQVKLAITQSRQIVDGPRQPARPVTETTIELQPGLARTVPFWVTPEGGDVCHLELRVADDAGKLVAAATARGVIDGEKLTGELGEVWKRYSTRIPRVDVKGTWAEIGAQLIKSGLNGPLKVKPSAAPNAAARLAFYDKHFPFYAEMLRGAAEAMKVPAERLAAIERTRADEACMGVFLNGPDGPINAYSKERGNRSLGGLGYLRVRPNRGLPFHVYTLNGWEIAYGVNAAGLSTSGATINCDTATEQEGVRVTREWLAQGKPLIPAPLTQLLATCKDVKEALALIDHPAAGFDFTGNLLLVDRSGDAAVVESVGIYHQIRRRTDELVFATGNYAHKRADGRFDIGANTGWAANTMLREHFLGKVLAERNGQASVRDAVWIMESPCLPGGMCQHIHDNPGLLFSSTSILAVSRTAELWISHGPPNQVRTERFSLTEER